MPNTNPLDGNGISRRRLLRSSGGAIGALGLGSSRDVSDNSRKECPEATFGSGMTHYDDSMHMVCTDDHPETETLQAEVEASLEENYPTVGALIEAGFIPYFDFLTGGSWSHWINPEFIGDDSMVDPERPESVLVDHTWWRPIGVMFIATDQGKPVDPPPSTYVEDGKNKEKDGACTPWHAHVGFPGRYSWWKYQLVYGNRTEFPCRTPWMMHVWIHSHPESIYAHAAPEKRGGPPAEPPGFDTDADTDEEELGPEHLPDAMRGKIERLW